MVNDLPIQIGITNMSNDNNILSVKVLGEVWTLLHILRDYDTDDNPVLNIDFIKYNAIDVPGVQYKNDDDLHTYLIGWNGVVTRDVHYGWIPVALIIQAIKRYSGYFVDPLAHKKFGNNKELTIPVPLPINN